MGDPFMKLTGRILHLVGVAVLATQLIPGLAGVIANVVCIAAGLVPATLASVVYRRPLTAIDPSGCFLWISIHHVLQLALTLLFMKVFTGKTLSAYGFNLHEWRLSLRIFGWLCLASLAPIFFLDVFPYLRSGQPPHFGYPLTARNVSGVLGFGFLGSGTCEDPLFFGLVLGLLARYWPGKLSMGRVSFPVAGLWPTLIFMMGHVHISFVPFFVTADFWQQVTALAFGLYYAAVVDRTGSLLCPVLSHGYWDGITEVALYLAAALMR